LSNTKTFFIDRVYTVIKAAKILEGSSLSQEDPTGIITSSGGSLKGSSLVQEDP
jgi:hypothetical protein